MITSSAVPSLDPPSPPQPACEVLQPPDIKPPQRFRYPSRHEILVEIYKGTPGLSVDKIKAVLEFAWEHLRQSGQHRVIFAYDEAQNLSDHAAREQFPLSVLLDVFQSIQKKGIPFMLVLVGLPTLFPKLVDARTYAERMFRVMTLTKLTDDESREAILKPIEVAECSVKLAPESVERIVSESAGYPYFIQFICREVYDVFIRQHADEEQKRVPVEAIQHKLDADFFAGSGQGSPTGSGNCSGPWPNSIIPTRNSRFSN